MMKRKKGEREKEEEENRSSFFTRRPVKGACGCIWQVIVFFASAACRANNSFDEGDGGKSNGDEYAREEKT